MAGSEAAPAVVDAGPIIHLDELGCLDLLEGLGELSIPQAVWEEVRRHRPQLRESSVPKRKLVDVPGNPSATLSALISSGQPDVTQAGPDRPASPFSLEAPGQGDC
jgi:hypothetical protein